MQRRTVLQLLGVAGAGTVAGGVSGAATDAMGDDHDTGASSDEQDAHDADPTEHDGDDGTAGRDEASPADCPDGLVTHVCHESVSEAVDRITANVEASPLTLLQTIDHAENAASVDEELPPTTLLVVGNPAVGTPLLQEERSIAIDLPQKLLVWEDDGRLKITYNDPQYLARRHGIEGQEERLDRIATVLEDLATSGWPE